MSTILVILECLFLKTNWSELNLVGCKTPSELLYHSPSSTGEVDAEKERQKLNAFLSPLSSQAQDLSLHLSQSLTSFQVYQNGPLLASLVKLLCRLSIAEVLMKLIQFILS